VACGEKQIAGAGGSLDPPGPLPMHLHTVYMVYSECLPALLNPLAERTCFSQVACGICEERLAQPIVLSCAHVFCWQVRQHRSL
jgi:hypothetical protein